MKQPSLRLLSASAIAMALACPLAGFKQDPLALQGVDAPPNGVWLDTLDSSKAPIRRPRAQRGQATPPPALVYKLSGTTYAHAVPLQSDGDLSIELGGAATRFVAVIGVDDGGTPPAGAAPAPAGSVVFGVWIDGRKVFESDVMKRGDAPKFVSIDLTAAKRLVLAVVDGNDGTSGDNAEWAGAAVITAPGQQAQVRVTTPPAEAAPALAASRSAAPRINYPRITGATPGRPFLFRIPASGDGPLVFSARNLPAGLSLDPNSGIITGALKQEGRTEVAVSVKGRAGNVANAVITIVGGSDALALTPPLGWNSWNVWAAQVDDARVRAAADGMVNRGLAAQGYTYINIDDAWEGPRNADGEITANQKFPDMKALADYVHAKGLKIGIYSSPGPRTCQQRFAGSYQHEEQDARTWAKWGFDYIKYDWCSYSDVEPLAARASLEALQKPYVLMRGILDKLDRDFVFSLCQYGWGSVWQWGEKVGGDLWRVTGDITDTWVSMSAIGFQQTGHETYAGPGHWNDTDMLVVGHVGWGRAASPRPTNLTPNEQLTHISLWALQAAPLLIGADMSQMDEFTINLLGNREVLAIDQDPMGRAAARVSADNWTQVWSRPLADGTMAVGMFNRAPEPMPVTVKFADIGVADRSPVRFPWTHQDLGGIAGRGKAFTATVPRHGVVLVKIGRAKKM
jgi:alpha-galactosidase